MLQVTLTIKNPACQGKRPVFHPWLGRSSGVENGNVLQYSSLEKSVARGAWQATVHGTAESGP